MRVFLPIAIFVLFLLALCILSSIKTTEEPMPEEGANHSVTCNRCHIDERRQIRESIHFRGNVICSDCHKGDPSKLNPLEAMDKAKGWKPRFTREEAVELCISCHSDIEKMKGFAMATDQYQNYLQSKHGKDFAKGDIVVPVCTTCHGYHKVLGKDDINSPTFAPNTPEICKRCHSDREKMVRYNKPWTTVEDFKNSVHWKALAEGHPERPGCIACHGSHNNLQKAEGTCTTCHVEIDKNFARSPCKGGTKGCMDCHRYHDTMKCSLEDYKTICSKCHNVDSDAWKSAQEIRTSLSKADKLYKDVEDRIRWLEMHGIDISGIEENLLNEKNRILKKNPLLHTFTSQGAEEILHDAESATQKLESNLRTYDKELATRRIRLIIFLGIINILVAIAGFMAKRKIQK